MSPNHPSHPPAPHFGGDDTVLFWSALHLRKRYINPAEKPSGYEELIASFAPNTLQMRSGTIQWDDFDLTLQAVTLMYGFASTGNLDFSVGQTGDHESSAVLNAAANAAAAAACAELLPRMYAAAHLEASDLAGELIKAQDEARWLIGHPLGRPRS